jgi:hypothetical protein
MGRVWELFDMLERFESATHRCMDDGRSKLHHPRPVFSGRLPQCSTVPYVGKVKDKAVGVQGRPECDTDMKVSR